MWQCTLPFTGSRPRPNCRASWRGEKLQPLAAAAEAAARAADAALGEAQAVLAEAEARAGETADRHGSDILLRFVEPEIAGRYSEFESGRAMIARMRADYQTASPRRCRARRSRAAWGAWGCKRAQ